MVFIPPKEKRVGIEGQWEEPQVYPRGIPQLPQQDEGPARKVSRSVELEPMDVDGESSNLSRNEANGSDGGMESEKEGEGLRSPEPIGYEAMREAYEMQEMREESAEPRSQKNSMRNISSIEEEPEGPRGGVPKSIQRYPGTSEGYN